MSLKKILACILCLSLLACTVCVTASAVSACTVTAMYAAYNSSNETVSCRIIYKGTFLPNQNYVFVLNNANGGQISLRTVNGAQLNGANNSFSYSFPLAANVVASSSKPLKLTVRSTQNYIIDTYTDEVAVISSDPTVTFADWDGTVLETKSVTYGFAATAPAAPEREGYSFLGWDSDFDIVTQDITVTAVYEQLPAEDSSVEESTVESSSSEDAYDSSESVEDSVADSSEESTEDDSSNPVAAACVITELTAIYSENAETVTFSVMYTGTFLTNQTYIFMLNDANGNLISAPSVSGTAVKKTDNGFSYSYHVSASVFNGSLAPLTATVKSNRDIIITPFTATVTTVNYLCGDVNADGFSDNLDAAYVLRYDAKLTEFSALQLLQGDVNGDGEVDSLDAAAILKYDAGIIDSLNWQN